MKLAKIEISDFRGFPGPQTYSFDLADGKNLLLYGENGSGKSSLYRALVEFFHQDREKSLPFHRHRNVFSGGSDRSLVNGHVSLTLDDGRVLRWPCLGQRPQHTVSIPQSDREFIADASLRKSFLDYRSLLRTNFGFTNLRERLFELSVTTLLANVPVSVGGGQEKTVFQLWTELLASKPYRHSKWQVRRVADAERAFNDGFLGVLPDIQRRTTDFLGFFAGAGLELRLDIPGARYDGSARLTRDRKFTGLELDFEVKLHGYKVPEWNDFLNEARLSALALSLYLAGTVLSNPSPPASVSTPLKLLVLDDVLIGLDLSNRLPVLDILMKHFGDYQIFLFTFDRVWFDMAHLQTLDSKRWIYAELFSERMGDPGYDVPVLKMGRGFLQQAKAHYQAHDYRAAAVYARVAFETRLKNFCSDKHLPVPYDKDSRRMSSENFWNAVTGSLGGDGKCHVDGPTKAKIESLRKVVLNPLSHADANSITKTEVEAAIKAVQTLSIN